MKLRQTVKISMLCLLIPPALFGQRTTNCFLQDFSPKYTDTPRYVDSTKTTVNSTVVVTLNGKDTLGPVSPYMFGNAIATWVAQDQNNATLISHLQLLAPNLIRYPGGSWSDVFFWSGTPGDLPDSVYANNVNNKFYPQSGLYVKPSLDSYYDLRSQLGCQGLITINYAYARYGLSPDPVAQAAHYAADWVRYDNGRTEFWEIGNENAGSWEYGYMIDTNQNMDGQPQIITGDLYGKHFKVFVDSMKAAAKEIGAVIYIGGQVIQNSSAATGVAATWNEGFFSQVGDSADFYIIHDYFPWGGSTTVQGNVVAPQAQINADISYVRGEISSKGAYSKPIALTEWNIRGTDLGGSDAAKISIANGLQAVTIFCEMLNNNVGMSCRWPIANWDADGMFYFNSSPVFPLWSPRPDFYYLYYLGRFVGDQMISTSVTTIKPTKDVFAYASRFTSGHTGVVVVNADNTYNRYVTVIPQNIGVGNKYYVYSLTGIGASAGLPDSVVVNNIKPTAPAWGPLDSLENIRAWGYPIEDSIKIYCPARSVQYILIDNGTRYLATGITENTTTQLPKQFTLQQNYPNPFNPQTMISYSLPQSCTVTLKIYDVIGHEVAVLLRNEKKEAGSYTVSFDGAKLPSGIYFYRITSEKFNQTRKMLLLK
jgi:hypothetical protein